MVKSVNASWWIQRWNELQPEKTAILFEDRNISYRQLHMRSNATSCWLQSLGIEKGDRVAVLLENCPEFIELYLACSRLGAIFVPINFRLAAPEVDYLIRHSRPRLFVFSKRFMNTFQSLDSESYRPPLLAAVVGDTKPSNRIFNYDLDTRSFEGKAPFITPSLGPADPEEPHVIMYTSGTTGRPKGAVLSHRKTFFNCLNAEIFFQLSFQDNMLVMLPLFHSGGLFIQASPCLFKGATLVIHPRFDPIKTYRDIERFKITKLLGVPTVFRSLLSVDPRERGDLSSLHVCAIGGEKVTHELLVECRENGFPLRQIMGQTETSILLWASEEESIARPGTVGRPVFHAEVTLVDKQGKRVSPNEVGEIVVRGSIMMKEYWQDPVQTEQIFSGGWLRTGDLARMDDDGYFYLVDRAKDMYISGGENVYPAEVERVLKEHPAVEDAAVVGDFHELWGECGHAFLLLRKDSSLTEDMLIAFCKERLASYKLPRKITFCVSFPRTPLGKVRKFLLKNNSHSESGK
ncbi:class I adenylate-forming enzyme family protein [Desulfomonile tiedjei]|uniref:Acyl-CoA synthetase (AMP-forming)/AMP-acid ligase II n=1 Tax=Desulfomonile tiedjei (strain ATCC 49306 / DSM 6799 / DCB-1) TaxID=706587 RepID=I4CDQ9_DESTA|nr:long-chain fatty acid--CoA ligase [Desulfomonile tiedjei]AFM27700.1 acyl-CoA synthetase (AMP-forming)/AMP-acid ligase II [Desulfomonile tiedjei DSM 6799]